MAETSEWGPDGGARAGGDLDDPGTLLNDLPGLVYRVLDGFEGPVVGVGPQIATLTGYRAEEIIGEGGIGWAGLVHPEDRERVRAAVGAGAAGSGSFQVVYRLRTRSGRERWVLDQGRILQSGDRVGYVQDVTGPFADRLVQATDPDEVRRQGRHLDLLQSVTSVVNDAESLPEALRLALPRVCRELGFGAAHVLLPDDGAGGDGGGTDFWWTEEGTSGARPDDDPDLRVPVRSGDRELAVLEFHVAEPFVPDPGLEALLGQVGTQLGRAWEREQARRERRAGEERFRELAEHIDDVFWVGSPADETREYVSPAYAVLWGTDPEALATDPAAWLEAVHPEDRERVEDVARRRASRGYEIQYRLLRADGEVRWIWDRAFPVIGPGGDVTRVVGVAEDVTDRTRLEAQLRAAHRMEAVGRLAGGIAHDFNNLLTVIRAQSDFLSMDLPEESPLLEEVDVIRGASDRAAELIRQLLAFSREQVLRPRVVDLAEVVRAMEQILIRVLGEDIHIRTEFQEGLWPVRVDPAQLEQVIMNLAVNARDAMPDGGVLTIDARRELMTPQIAAGRTELGVGRRYVRLDVTDTGHGMEEAVRARIFEPFFTTKRSRGGTGLGLAMVYGIVKQSGGTIHVDSAPGRGTTFVLRFPPADSRPSEDPEGDGVPVREGPRPGTILVVEDDPAVRRVTRRTLTREGMDVRVAADAENGLEILDSDPGSVAFLLTDLVLPGMSGRALLEAVRSRHPRVRCVAMSGYADGSPARRVDLPPGVVFLPKPFTPQDLLRALDAAADEGSR